MASSSSADSLNQPSAAGAMDYYTLLGVERSCNQDEIKRGYRKMALRYHPDKTGSDPERFQRIVKAYEILSDEKKRQIYDKYGEQGIHMLDQFGEMAPFLDPDMIIAINGFFGLGTFVLVLLIIFPALISIRADNRNTWSYTALFTPLFFIDVAVIFCLNSFSGSDDEPEGTDDHESDREGRAGEECRTRKAKTGVNRQKALYRAFKVTYWLLFTLFHILIAVRLDNYITVSWAIIFAPWLVMEMFHFSIGVLQVREKFIIGVLEPLSNGTTPETDDEGAMTSRPLSIGERIGEILECFWPWALRIAQAVLLIIQFDSVSATPPSPAMDWRTVFIPTYLCAFFMVGSIVYDTLTGPPPMMPNGTPAPTGAASKQKAMAIAAKMVFFSVFAILFYTFIGLLIQRLRNPDPYPSTPVIFIPFFIVLSFLFCCTCCCLPMIVRSMTSAVEEEIAQRNQSNAMGNIVPADHRIADTAANSRARNSDVTINEGRQVRASQASSRNQPITTPLIYV
ncbi:hypothetical protein SeMB42_g00018 [Synchytrium endobioticum]|uniref:J domain-containing protein n=1 Tax=Synchytrium endobioticum TaxID=286115 RepID=A0A507DAL2_9FUNG|nr:hypothetical protein SeLEV6574_g02058 [Synchytrium endobioticum]TPX55036.1 hypothetical protein SeMB42_g00018 [Synchytrium endobioticum]